MAATKAKQLELTVEYSYAIRANIGNYESAQVTVGKTEKWGVAVLTPAEIDKLWKERFAALKEEIDTAVETEYNNTSQYGEGDDE